MKRNRLHTITILILWVFLYPTVTYGQTVDMNPGDFYRKHITQESRAIPFPPLREDDVIWMQTIWRNINFQERFNQFFYYPLDKAGVDGAKNFAYMLWEAVENGTIPIYEDDDLLIPMDNAEFIARYTKPDTLVIEIEDDEDEDLIEYRSVVVPKEFSSEDVLQIRLKEVWYQEKQVTGQYVRIVALALTQDMYKEVDGERDFMGTVTLFWVPMLAPEVRDLFVRKRVYYNPNLANLPSWERIFIERYFDSYITKQSNTYNRTISSYLTGEEAIIESQRIENYLFEMSEDQWEW